MEPEGVDQDTWSHDHTVKHHSNTDTSSHAERHAHRTTFNHLLDVMHSSGNDSCVSAQRRFDCSQNRPLPSPPSPHSFYVSLYLCLCPFAWMYQCDCCAYTLTWHPRGEVALVIFSCFLVLARLSSKWLKKHEADSSQTISTCVSFPTMNKTVRGAL